MRILTTNNQKIEKAGKKGWKTAGIHLAPYTLANVRDINNKLLNVCPDATLACKKYCLNTAGHGVMNPVKLARKKKTARFLLNQQYFMVQLFDEIAAFQRHCIKKDVGCSIRLNLTSDVAWENIHFQVDSTQSLKTIFDHFPDIQFYDYSKSIERGLDFAADRMSANYHLTFSFDQENMNTCYQGESYISVVRKMRQISFIYNKETPPDFDFTNGNSHDLTFLHGRMIGLHAIGKARKHVFDNNILGYLAG